MSTWNLKEKSTGNLLVTLEGDLWKEAQKKAFDKLAKDVEVEGFRKGKAPKNLVEKHISKQSILMEAAEMAAQDSLNKGIDEHDLWLVARPELGIDEINEDKVIYNFIVTVKPEVKLGEYKGLEYKVEPATVEEDEVNNELTKLQEEFAELKTKAGAVEDGDTAVIDFEGFKDGVAFEGGQSDNYALVIGSKTFIPGFEEQVVGMSAGEEKDIDVTFPENYGSEDLAGQPVVFKVKVNEVKEKILPAIDDELAKDANIDGVETLDELKKNIEERLMTSKEQANENQALDALITKLVENTEVDLPDAMIDQEANEMINEQNQRMMQQGFSLTQFLQMTGQTTEQFKEQLKGDAENRIKVRLVLEAVAKAEDLKATEEDLEKEYETIATTYSMEVDQVKSMITADNLTYDVEMRKALDFVKEAAKK